ncbi:MAG: endonuclease/exonuclease/phosphatase family protein [Planctomycetota bacterium]
MNKKLRYLIVMLSLMGLVVGVILTCAHTPLRLPETPTGPYVKVLTWNVNWGMPEAEQTLAVLRQAEADVVCLQETTPRWESFLRGWLGKEYPYMKFRHAGGAGGQALLSKKAFQELQYVVPSDGWFAGWIYEVQTDIGPLQILSVHLHPALNEQGSFSASAYFSTKQTRLNEIKTLFPLLKKDRPTLLVGDFNEGTSSRAVEWIVTQGFTNALAEFDYKSDTWKWKTSLLTLSKRFDHILYSKEIYCLVSEVIKSGGSDHFPVRAIFEERKLPSKAE